MARRTLPPAPPRGGRDGRGRLTAVPTPPAPTAPLRRRPVRAAAAGLLVVVFALIGALLYSSAGHTEAVLAVRRPVRRGQVILASDLATTRISRSAALRPVPAEGESGIVGHRAAVTLTPGELLTPAAVSGHPLLTAGRAEVGLSLHADELPQGALSTGDEVDVVLTGVQGSSEARGKGVLGSPAGTIIAGGTVAGPPAVSASSGQTELLLVVPSASAPQVATAAAAERVAVVLLPAGKAG